MLSLTVALALSWGTAAPPLPAAVTRQKCVETESDVDTEAVDADRSGAAETYGPAEASESDAEAAGSASVGASGSSSSTTVKASGRKKRKRRKRRRKRKQEEAQMVGVRGQPGECVDKTLQEQLLAKRKYRLTRDRLFVKSLRHELTLSSGYYVSDLFDSTFTLAGSYTFFMSENFGAELSVGWSRLRSTVADQIEDSSNFDLPLENDDIVRVFGSLQWSPLYGKLRLIAGSIWRYDLYFLAGPGVIVDPISFGAAGNFGIGFRVFLHQAVALRFEVRDYLYRQELLSEAFTVNDLSFTGGLSVLLPFKN